MFKFEPVSQLDRAILEILLATEARGESLEGQAAVVWTVLNRAEKPRWWGRTLREVMLKKWQYEGLQTIQEKPMKSVLSIPAALRKTVRQTQREIVGLVLDGWMSDPVGGATHYHAASVSPEWAKTLPHIRTIGGHRFFLEG